MLSCVNSNVLLDTNHVYVKTSFLLNNFVLKCDSYFDNCSALLCVTVVERLVGCVAWREPLLRDSRCFDYLVTIIRHISGMRQRVTKLILLYGISN
jgi:hypothetical protein